MTDDTYRLVQRRGSKVGHVVNVLGPRRSRTALCGQWAPGYSSWNVEPGDLPTCKRCAKRLAERQATP